MYIPKAFNVEEMSEVVSFINNHSFGILVTVQEGRPVATHIPLMIHQQGDDYYLTGHLANQNEQVNQLEENVMVIFQGPHAYVSSSWYDHENVSTWNYEAVHIYGKSRMLSQEELQGDLTALLDHYEKGRPDGKTWDKLSESSKKQINGITGFEIKIEEVQAAYKMSQNRNARDYEQIITELEKNQESITTAEEMKRLREK
ncbi:FMN-binding negative transcriptional regulator [Macrococcus lamae]|uniref:FMN-binding negative transcriptional regulator n=1 Tax=Macrococcus lamae TaxID=198484 RepID=A0A4R6BSQ4_9STAP|nr:FMN-binding negative transcriptional regulator [Macrococcus lamae]TDM05231.1 FMN-binding negative transcriptional regulator [Macrococcus lamae]